MLLFSFLFSVIFRPCVSCIEHVHFFTAIVNLLGISSHFDVIVFSFLQIPYKLARDQFADRLHETFLVLTDDAPPADIDPSPAARRLSLSTPVHDPRPGGHSRGRKHHRESDSMSTDSASNPKKVDQTKSVEKRK